MLHSVEDCFLVVDIGGTNTRVALSDGVRLRQGSIRRYRNAEHAGLESVLQDFMAAEGRVVPQAVCVDVAGPVHEGRARLTNLAWDISIDSIAAASGTRKVALLNDMQAQGYALEHIAQSDLTCVRQGQSAPATATKLVVNIGTGFNATAVLNTGSGWMVAASESGHTNMPARTDRDMRLCAFVEQRHGFAAIDDILSGRGLVRIYAWLASEAGTDTELSSSDIMEGCRNASDPIAVEAVRTFVRLFAMVTANLALIQLPIGGIYMVGGLASAILPFMDRFGFEQSFLDKGRFSNFMERFPIQVVQDDYAALKGCAAHLEATSFN